MLFSRIYNWVKYKTLPPSVLFLNRLFVERDSKHRRVTSNLGLTFRNSKWSTYARTNINLNSQVAYFTFLKKTLYLLVTIIILFKFTKYYNLILVSNIFSSIVWFLIDADLYLKAVFVSSFLCSYQLFFSSVYSSIFHQNDQNLGLTDKERGITFPKRLHKPLLYAWTLKSKNSDASLKDFFSNTNYRNTLALPTLSSLYKITYLLSLSETSIWSLSKLNRSITNPISTLTLNSVSSKKDFISLYLDYASLGYTNNIVVNRSSEFTLWSLNSINNELNLNIDILKTKSGLFYLPQISQSLLNNMNIDPTYANSVTNSVNSQMAIIRWQRWLYKYNLLHRASVKGSSQLTAVKKLIGLGAYSKSNSVTNIWSSSVFNEDDSSLVNRSLLLLGSHGNASNSIAPSNLLAFYKPNLTSLSYYNDSYIWFLKRSYVLNTLESNSAALRPITQISTLRSLNSETAKLEQSKIELLNSITSSVLNSSTDIEGGRFLNSQSSVTNNTYLSYSDSSIFNRSQLNLITSLTKNTSNSIYFYYQPFGYRTKSPLTHNYPKFK